MKVSLCCSAPLRDPSSPYPRCSKCGVDCDTYNLPCPNCSTKIKKVYHTGECKAKKKKETHGILGFNPILMDDF